MSLSFWFNHFLDSRAEIHQIFAMVFWKFKTSKSHSEINWPLVGKLKKYCRCLKIEMLPQKLFRPIVGFLVCFVRNPTHLRQLPFFLKFCRQITVLIVIFDFRINFLKIYGTFCCHFLVNLFFLLLLNCQSRVLQFLNLIYFKCYSFLWLGIGLLVWNFVCISFCLYLIFLGGRKFCLELLNLILKNGFLRFEIWKSDVGLGWEYF